MSSNNISLSTINENSITLQQQGIKGILKGNPENQGEPNQEEELKFSMIHILN